MRELTIHEIDAELAEQLPARELMSFFHNSGGQTAVAINSSSTGDAGATATGGAGGLSGGDALAVANTGGNENVAIAANANLAIDL